MLCWVEGVVPHSRGPWYRAGPGGLERLASFLVLVCQVLVRTRVLS